MSGNAPTTTGVSHVYPIGSRLNERGRLEVGGCDVVELAEEFGTPAYVYAEDDIRARARQYTDAFKARTDHFEVVYASKAFPCTAAYRLLADEGLACDVASGGELHMALRGGFAPERIYLHGNNKSESELEYAIEQGVGHIVVDSFDQQPPSIDEYVDTMLRGAPDGVTVLCEPGRSLVGNAGVTIYTVGTVKGIPGVRTYVAVDGGMSDNLRPMLYAARYEAEIADRLRGDRPCTVAGKHCESGDILVRDVELDDPRPGDVLVIPATGADRHAMAHNYNGIPRPPVIFCRDSDAREVGGRETFEDLTLRVV